jgi:DNA modification methylase
MTSTTPAGTAPWRNRITGAGAVAPADLIANPANWRTHPGAQRDALRGSLSSVGWVQQILINARTGFVVDGHARVEEALARGEPTVPVLYVDLSPEEEALVLATLDPIAAMAVPDADRLAALLAEITVDDAGLAALLRDLGGSEPKAGLTDPDDVPDLPAETTIARGDLYLLGDHRLLCGDATDAADVARLLDGATPRLLVTDPPYGVELNMEWRDGVYNARGPAEPSYLRTTSTDADTGATRATSRAHARTSGHRNTAISGDTRADWSGAYALVPSLEVAYVWHASAHVVEVIGGLEAIGFAIRQQLVWVKTIAAMSRSAYNWQHEPCLYAVRTGATAEWIGDTRQTTVWELASPKMLGGGSTEAKFDHPTQKPAEAMRRPIANHRGDVYEPFSGSGTTLVAAEQLGRRCYAMEIEPCYVQVALERWEAFTGRQAERVDG